MARDVVAEREKLGVHELLGARGDLIARRVRAGELRDERREVERLLERVELANDVARRLALGRSFLRRERRRAAASAIESNRRRNMAMGCETTRQ